MADLQLNAYELHVWTASLAFDRTPEGLTHLLSPEERARAARFHAEGDRVRFIICRGVLRRVLSRYLDVAPEALEFEYGRYGKPSLRPQAPHPDLRFSVSHCRDCAMYAVALGREVGIDLECIREDIPADDIAARFFSDSEAAAIRALPAAERIRAFFRVWTRKEAFLKARGYGLSAPLRDFAVSSDGPARLLWTHPDRGDAVRWRLQDVNAGGDHAAAVAAEGADWTLREWAWA